MHSIRQELRIWEYNFLTIRSSESEVKGIDTTSCVTNVSVVSDSWIQRICEYYNSCTKIIQQNSQLHGYADLHTLRPSLISSVVCYQLRIILKCIRSLLGMCQVKASIDKLEIVRLVDLCLNPALFSVSILFRIGGRTSHHPILISHTHPVASAIVRYFYNQAHTGCEQVLSLVHEKYWCQLQFGMFCN